MNLFSRNGIILSAAILFTGIATATKTDNYSAPNTQTNNSTYTASGKMDLKTAMMLKNLLRNPHLKVQAHVGKQPTKSARHSSHPMDVLVNYTISGKTDRQTVLKLKKLLQSSAKIKIIARANINVNAIQRRASQDSRSYQQRFQSNNAYIKGYTPFYYNGFPPVYRQGNVVWYPVPIYNAPTQQNIGQVAPYPMDYSLTVAAQ